jgi:hypothetical protein
MDDLLPEHYSAKKKKENTTSFTFWDVADKIESEADVAQLVEQLIRNQQVSGSIPLVGSSLVITHDV